jgi:hypothetical protein
MVTATNSLPERPPVRVLYILEGSLERGFWRAQWMPVLERLVQDGYTFDVISFERELPAVNSPVRADLARLGVEWVPLVLPRQPKAVQPAFIVVAAAVRALIRRRKRRYDVVHCRGYLPAEAGLLLRQRAGTGFIFELRTLAVDDQLDLNRWRRNGVRQAIGRFYEQAFLLGADVVITPSTAFQTKVRSMIAPAGTGHSPSLPPVLAIPGLVDLGRFNRSEASRGKVRDRNGWAGRLTLGFAGEAWRALSVFPALVTFLKACQAADPDALLALYLTGKMEDVRRAAAWSAVSPDDLSIIPARPGERLSDYLSAFDVGLAFHTPRTTGQGLVNPARFGEYLAAGLPVVVNLGSVRSGRKPVSAASQKVDTDQLLSARIDTLVQDSSGTPSRWGEEAADGVGDLASPAEAPGAAQTARLEPGVNGQGAPRWPGDSVWILEHYNAGIAVDPEDHAQLWEQVKQVLNMVLYDPDARSRCRSAAALEFGVDEVARLYRQAYATAVEGGQARKRTQSRRKARPAGTQ